MVINEKNKKIKEKVLSRILTEKERKVICKKISGKKLSQQDSNRLSKSIRPKLIEIKSIDAGILLDKLEYNQKAISIEGKIKKILLKHIKNISAIVLYGSVVQNSWKDYNDIDVLVIVNKKFWNKIGEKYGKIIEIKNILKKDSINMDLEIYDKQTFQKSYSSNISLVYQLKDSKVIYGKLNLQVKIEIPKQEIRMKMDYSILERDENYSGLEIYKAIRNLILLNLVIRKVIDNRELINLTSKEIGSELIYKLKNNCESQIERKIALLHLKRLLNKTFEELNNSKWEKIALSNH